MPNNFFHTLLASQHLFPPSCNNIDLSILNFWLYQSFFWEEKVRMKGCTQMRGWAFWESSSKAL